MSREKHNNQQKVLQAYVYTAFPEVTFQVSYFYFPCMEYACRKAGIYPVIPEQFNEIFHFARPSACNKRYCNYFTYRLEHREVKASAHAVGVYGVEHDFSGSKIVRAHV